MSTRLAAAQQLRVIKGLEAARMSELAKRMLGELIAQLDQGPLPEQQINALFDEVSSSSQVSNVVRFARAVEKAHGIR